MQLQGIIVLSIYFLGSLIAICMWGWKGKLTAWERVKLNAVLLLSGWMYIIAWIIGLIRNKIKK